MAELRFSPSSLAVSEYVAVNGAFAAAARYQHSSRLMAQLQQHAPAGVEWPDDGVSDVVEAADTVCNTHSIPSESAIDLPTAHPVRDLE